jgi:hypothetical protein
LGGARSFGVIQPATFSQEKIHHRRGQFQILSAGGRTGCVLTLN